MKINDQLSYNKDIPKLKSDFAEATTGEKESSTDVIIADMNKLPSGQLKSKVKAKLRLATAKSNLSQIGAKARKTIHRKS